MWKIIDRLYLGDSRDAGNLSLLIETGVSHILNCTSGVACSFPESIQYLQLPVSSAWFAEQIDAVCRYIDEGRQAGTVMVHCSQARERGPAAIIAYLCHVGFPLDQALALVETATVTRSFPFSPPSGSLLRPIVARFDT